jgi:hypothetical protein
MIFPVFAAIRFVPFIGIFALSLNHVRRQAQNQLIKIRTGRKGAKGVEIALRA